MWFLGQASQTSLWDSLDPIREELFGIERLETHARSLAQAQTITKKSARGHPLAARLADNEAVLLSAYTATAKAIEDSRPITPAAEELINNYYIIEKQIHQIRSDLPAGYYRQLPKLASGPFAGYPRVFGMVWAFVAHTDSNLDRAALVAYIKAYQEVQPLMIGELWAVSITLRIILIENLRRLAQRRRHSRADRDAADRMADRLLGTRGLSPEPLGEIITQWQDKPITNSFAVQLVHRLRDQDPWITPALTWLDQQLALRGSDPDAAVREEHRMQGSGNVTVRNIIQSLRKIADLDWKDIFEQVSLVDRMLGKDTAFGQMDFPTRNLYRTAIEELARYAPCTEFDVVTKLQARIDHAHSTSFTGDDPRRCNAGYYLVAAGRPQFEAELGFEAPWQQWPMRINNILGIGGYITLIALLTACLVFLPLFDMAQLGLGAGMLAILCFLGLVPAIDVAVALANRAVPWGFNAQILPAMEFRDGISTDMRTLVAVPTLLGSGETIALQVERLEIHYLANPDDALHFALLTDWLDAASEHSTDDAELLAIAAKGIADLNLRHGQTGTSPRFFLLHRARVWNESENCWMGWERKRGKLHELNRLLRGATDTTFLPAHGSSLTLPPDIRYVVTLDSDTRLPRDTVRRLVGKMAHPLNQPRFDEAQSSIAEGYGVLQPRVTPSLPVGQEGSLFQRIFSSMGGIDPYASAISDVYQDLFGEGSYAGKGIYNIDAFEAALSGRVPDSTLLSHDLFEGIFARAGLVTDIEVVEEFPARYDVGAMRHHRWARGDWQLLPWIWGAGPKMPGNQRAPGTIPAIGKWKMIDNLRRTLSAPLAVLALLVGWFLPLHMAQIWTFFIVATIVLPALIPVISAIPPRYSNVTLASHLRALGSDLTLAASLSALVVTFLAHQAWLMGDAIVRTLWRLLISRKHLLEWIPAALASSGAPLDISSSYRRMFGALIMQVWPLPLLS